GAVRSSRGPACLHAGVQASRREGGTGGRSTDSPSREALFQTDSTTTTSRQMASATHGGPLAVDLWTRLPAPGVSPLADDRVALVKRVKEANDIVDVVGGYLALRPAGPTFKALCPFHDDSRPSFDVDPRRQRYRCWACGKYGDVISFVQEHERVDFREALELLARRAGIPLEKGGGDRQHERRARMLE